MTFQRELAVKIRAAIDYLAEMGVTSGDIVDGLCETESALNSTLAMYVYTPDDLVNVADDVDAKFTEEDAEIFLKAMHAGNTKDFQGMGYGVIRTSLEESLAEWNA